MSQHKLVIPTPGVVGDVSELGDMGQALELSDASNGEKNIAPKSLLSCSYHLKCTMKKTNLRHTTAANMEDILQTETAVMIQNQPPFHWKNPQLHSP